MEQLILLAALIGVISLGAWWRSERQTLPEARPMPSTESVLVDELARQVAEEIDREIVSYLTDESNFSGEEKSPDIGSAPTVNEGDGKICMTCREPTCDCQLDLFNGG